MHLVKLQIIWSNGDFFITQSMLISIIASHTLNGQGRVLICSASHRLVLGWVSCNSGILFAWQFKFLSLPGLISSSVVAITVLLWKHQHLCLPRLVSMLNNYRLLSDPLIYACSCSGRPYLLLAKRLSPCFSLFISCACTHMGPIILKFKLQRSSQNPSSARQAIHCHLACQFSLCMY